VGSDAPKNPQNQSPQKPSGQELGWGSNIQNARLARAAQLALQKGENGLALDYAQRASQAAPNDPQLWFLLGYAARLNGKYQQSIDAYDRGLRLSPSTLDGISGLAQTYSITGRTEDAQRLLKQVVAADPKRVNEALLLGDLYMRSGDYSQALEWLSRAERVHPDSRSELLMAISYEHLKKMDLASRYLDMAKKRSPDNPEIQRTMAGYFREVGKYSEAIAALKSIRNPKPDVTAELAYTYQLDGKPNDAAKMYAVAANAMPKDMTLQLSAAQADVAVSSMKEADTFLTRAAAIDANYYRLHAIRGEIARIQDNVPDAVKEYNLAVSGLPAEPVEGPLYGIQLHMDLLELYRAQKDTNNTHRQLEIAQQQIGQVSDQGPGRAPFLRLRALIRMNAGDLDAALRDINDAVAISAHDPGGLQLNGDILMKIGRTEDAIVVYKRVLAIDPVNRFALISLGYASRAAHRDDAAEKYFQRLEQADPSFYVPYLALGDLYTARREFKAAQVSYNKAYELSPKSPLIMAGAINAAVEGKDLQAGETWLSRITNDMLQEPQVLREKERILSFKGDYQQSAAVGREAIKVLPTDRDVVVYLGYDLLHLEKYDELLSLTSSNLDVFPKEPDIPLLQGYVHKHEGQSDEARKDFTLALDRDPTVVTAYVNRGYTFNDLSQPDSAAKDFESALKREPDNGEAQLGLAYADLDLHKPQGAIRHAEQAARIMGDSKDIHVIRATAFGREGALSKAAIEYKAALKFAPNDGALHLGLGNTLFSQRQFRDAILELETAERDSMQSAEADALLARSYASLDDRDNTLRYVGLAERHAQENVDRKLPPQKGVADAAATQQGAIFVSTGEALSILGDQKWAMDRFRRAIAVPNSDRVGVRLAIAQVMSQQGHANEAERQIALALMEAESGDTAPPNGNEYIEAADVFRSTHDYQLSQTYLERAKAAGASDADVRIGLANNYLALGDTTRAHAELAAISTTGENAPSYQYLLAQANVYRQQHQGALALTSFAQASNAGGDDQTAQQGLLEAGADEGLRITPKISVLSNFSIEPVFEDSTVYVLDSKLDAPFSVPPTSTSLLPPPRSSLATQSTNAFHLHVGHLPTPSGFFQVRNVRGTISVPSTNSIVNRNTTDYSFNFGLNPTVNLGNNVLTFNSGVQATVRRDSKSPIEMNQNLFRMFTYMSTSSFFNAVSVSGYVIRESGPFTERDSHSSTLTGAVDFRVGAPWGKTTLVTGWGANKQQFNPQTLEDFYTSSYIGLERHFGPRINVRGVAEDVRAWRVFGSRSGIAQNLRPAGTVDFTPNRNWNFRASTAYSSTRSFHSYDAIQNGFSASYAVPFRHKFNDESGAVTLQYPIRFSAGMQQETFFNFTGGQNQQFRPYISITLF
jgi:tetratricopeptide (TPR) repeat protein